jgi:hypothetical protein
MHMKRIGLALDGSLLETAKHELGAKTYSDAVNLALKEVLRVRKIQALPQFFGQGLWHRDLSEMREDRRRRKAQPASTPRERPGR